MTTNQTELQTAIRRRVDSGTYARGSAYARQGAVTTYDWRDRGSRVVGVVRGKASKPYVSSVTVTRPTGGGLKIHSTMCSCPMTGECKHVVALLLVSGGGGPVAPAAAARPEPPPAAPKAPAKRAPATPARGRPPAVAAWEQSLQAVLSSGPPEPETERPDFGLQFEVMIPPAKLAAGPRIRVRPLVPGQSGRWVRTGINWSRLEYPRYWQHGPTTAEHLELLKELLALSRASQQQHYYSYSVSDDLWLETIKSRRVWDLLAEARALGLPLLLSGRAATPVALSRDPATVVVDARRESDGLHLRPRLMVGDQTVSVGGAVSIGSPAHGLAWWNGPGDVPPDHLYLAPLSSGLDETMRQLLTSGPIDVPSRDTQRFVETFLPALTRRVPMTSSDGSVELPEPEPRRLVLTITHQGGDRCGLQWSWTAGDGTPEDREGLWQPAGQPEEQTRSEQLVATVTQELEAFPQLMESTFFGPRLAAQSELAGITAAEFVSGRLDGLGELEGVTVEVIGELPNFREALSAPVVVLGGKGSTKEGDWFDLMVTVTVEDEEVPFHQLFTALAEGESHLVLPSGTYFSLDRQELRRLAELIAEARELGDGLTGAVRVSRFQASWWEELRALGLLTQQAAAWESRVRSLTEAGDRVVHPVPATLAADLRPYQLDGFHWLAYLHEHQLGGILADDMGLGKTVQALALMCHVRERSASAPPFLVVAPTSVVANWQAECQKFAPDLAAVSIAETTPRRGRKLADLAAEANIVITSYALFRLEFDEYDAIEWSGLFLDEAQFVKNHTAQGYRRARMLSTPFKLAMTGTPMENSLMELWSLLSITAPGLLRDPTGFAEYYRQPIERDHDPERLDQLRRRIRPLMLRRTKEQVAGDLPEKLEQVLELDLNPRQQKLYQTYLHRERQKVLGLIGDLSKNRFEILRSLTLLRQASLDVGLVDEKHARVPSTKLDALMEMLEEIVADGHRVLVFSQFTRFLTSARRRLEAADIDLCYLDGRTRNRATVIDRFRSGEAPVFLISLKAGGFGLNLTEADYCILLDPWWNPATEAQAIDRAHRIGQTKKVMVYRLVAKGTIEEKVMAMKAKKSALFASVMDTGDFGSGAMTAEDIQSLLS